MPVNVWLHSVINPFFSVWIVQEKIFKRVITNGCTGQISAVTFFALCSKKAAIKNLLGEPGVIFSREQRSLIGFKKFSLNCQY
jgi:hypothetical protein